MLHTNQSAKADGSVSEVSAFRQMSEEEGLMAAGVPFYPSIERAAEAASKLVDYYQRRESR